MKTLGRIFCCWMFDHHAWVTTHHPRGPYLESVSRTCPRCGANWLSVLRPYRDDHDAG